MGNHTIAELLKLANGTFPETIGIEFREFNEYLVGDNGTVLSLKFGKLRKLTCSIDKRSGRSVSGGRLLSWWLANAFHKATYFDGAVADHIDGNKSNDTASNIQWLTPFENIRKHFGLPTDVQWIVSDPEGCEHLVRHPSAFSKAHGLDCTAIGRLVNGRRNTHKGWRLVKKIPRNPPTH